MIYELADYEKFPEPAKRSLTFLRGVRDNIAARIESEAASISGKAKASEWVEGMCGGYYTRSGYHWLRSTFAGHIGEDSNLQLLEVFKLITDRIHELEAAAIGRAA
jgi:hypothetical protein